MDLFWISRIPPSFSQSKYLLVLLLFAIAAITKLNTDNEALLNLTWSRDFTIRSSSLTSQSDHDTGDSQHRRLYSAFDCGGRQWELNYSKSSPDMEIFQNWIYAWQHSCGVRNVDVNPAQSWGIGRTLHLAVKNFVTAIEMNMIWRPTEQNAARVSGAFLWAEDNPSNCTLGVRSIDCYFLPISTCGFPSHNENNTHLASKLAFSNQAVDSCAMAQLSKKPLIWVHGQFFHYLSRLRPDIQVDVDEKKKQVFGILGTSKDAFKATIGVHVRGGAPDTDRKVANLSYYIDAVDTKAAEMAGEGRPVGLVYLCSDLPEENIISTESMNQRFPRPFKFVVLPHITLGAGEAELNLRGMLKNHPPKRDLFMEYMADVEILASVDFFIGTFSSVYPMVVALRVARGSPDMRFTSCFLQIQDDVPPLLCEGKNDTAFLWHHFFGGYNALGDSSFGPSYQELIGNLTIDAVT